MNWKFWQRKQATYAPAPVVVGTLGGSSPRNVGIAALDESNALAREARSYHSTSLGDWRYAKNADDLLKLLSKWDPDVSAGVWNFLRLADSGLKVKALDKDMKPDAKAQERLNELLFRMSGMNNFKDWSIYQSIEHIANSMLKQVILRGGLGAELVLDNTRKAKDIAIVDAVTVQFKHPKKGVFKPFQTDSNGQEIKLDVPTFFWSVLDADPDDPYETPPFLPVLQAVMFNMSVMQDLERVVKKVAYPRIAVKVIEATLRKFAPAAAQVDDTKMTNWLREQKASIGEALRDLAPEDAAVFFDSLEVNVLEMKNNPTIDFRPLKEIIDQRIITGLKSLPTILGRQFGSSQTLSGVEALLYANSVVSVQKVVAWLLSRILTLALNLEGVRGFVQVKYGPVNMKPKDELEAFLTLKQARTLELLSLGLISDEEAAEELTGDSTLPKTFKPLSGTGFYKKSDTSAAAAVNSTRNPNASEQAGGGRNAGR